MTTDKSISENNDGERLYQTPDDKCYRETRGGARQAVSALEALKLLNSWGCESVKLTARFLRAMDAVEADRRR